MNYLDYLDITLESNGRTLQLGMSASGEKREFGITKYEGLESSEFELKFMKNALVDGDTTDGKRIAGRPIHLEATLRDGANNSTNRQRIIKFFNPKYTGKLTAEHSGTVRNIEYEIEGWDFATPENVFQQLSIVVDLICPDPYMKNVDNFGKNMADITPQIAFPWRVVPAKIYDTPDPFKGLTLRGQICGYRTLKKEVVLANDGDVPCSVQIKFVATRGTVTNPKITLTGTGQYMRIIADMQKGDSIIVDTNPRHQVIEYNGAKYYQHIDRRSDPFMLAVGDNYLEYDADTNYTNLDVMLYYIPLYLGV